MLQLLAYRSGLITKGAVFRLSSWESRLVT